MLSTVEAHNRFSFNNDNDTTQIEQSIDNSPSSIDETMIVVITQEGNEYYGLLISDSSTYIELKTETLGLINIHKKHIKSIQTLKVDKSNPNRLWPENFQATRYFWQPNGYGLEKGEGYYQNIWVFFNQASYGITDYFSMSVGTIPLFLFSTETPLWIVPKVSLPVIEDILNIGVGVMAGTIVGVKESSFAIPFGVATYGSKDYNLSIGVGYAILAGEISESPLITISGMSRISRRGYLVTENFIISDNGSAVGLMMLGGRTVMPKLSIDYGGVIPINMGDSFILPWLGITIPF